jgi:hypothetical protein
MPASLSAHRMPSRLFAPALVIAALLVAGIPVAAQEEEPGTDPVGRSSRAPFLRADAPPGSTPGIELQDVIAGGPGFVAVGGGFLEGAQAPTAAIWVSDDGIRWQRAPLFGAAAVGQVRAITAGPEGLVAVGNECCPDRSAVWTSPDGLAWTRLPDSPAFESSALLAVAATDAGIVAAGCEATLECGNGFFVSSPDGRTWSEPRPLPLVPFAIVPTTGGLLVLGTSETYEGSPVVARSETGETWEVEALGGRGTLHAALETPDGVIAVGGFSDFDTGDITGIIVRAGPDGTWTPVSSPRLRGMWVEDVESDGAGGLILAGWRQSGQAVAPTALATVGLEEIRPVRFARPARADGFIHALAVSPDGSVTVAVGSRVSDEGLLPAAWVSRPRR